MSSGEFIMMDAPKGRTGLVVDDSATVRRFVVGLLRNLGFEVAQAPSGVETIQQCQIATPDLVLLDWNMPGMDGITCLKALRSMHFDRHPAIVMCTTESQIGKIQQALEAGADEYIMKPFDQGVLLDKLVQLNLA